MIRIEKVNKYFNRKKANEIHVVDNTSLELPDIGIVTLLGASGSGKTTLLNVIGGLDKINSGKIFVDGEKITKRFSGKIDSIRNAKIGYVFQNFNLIDDESVFDNVAIALKMIGIRNKEVIRKRVNYCLEAVGIYQFRFKKASDLSGGQRQRVAIARAIVKNPQIIIADEPTGNLDSSNTLEIMNLIKKLSGERLVLLVTHEEELAGFYSDRIIRIRNGKVESDNENDNTGKLNYQLDNRIYLHDMPVQSSIQSRGLELNLFSDRELNGRINIAVRGGNLFIDTKNKFSIIDETGNIELIEGNYTELDKSIFESSAFNYSAFLPKKHKVKYKPIYTLLNSTGKGLKNIRNYRFLRKLLLLGFVISAFFAFYAVSNIIGVKTVKKDSYMASNPHYITLSNPKKNDKIAGKLKKIKGVTYVLPGESFRSFEMPMNDYFQTSGLFSKLPGSVVSAKMLSGNEVFKGRTVKKSTDIVVDKMILKKFLGNKFGNIIGLDTYEKFIGRTLRVQGLPDFRIVGISNTESPSIFVKDGILTDIVSNAPGITASNVQDPDIMTPGAGEPGDGEDNSDDKVKNYGLAKGIVLKKGKTPIGDFETLVNEYHKDEYKIGRAVNKKMAGRKLTVVGYYTSKDQQEDSYFVSKRTILLNDFHKNNKVTVYSKDPEGTVDQLNEKGYSPTLNTEHEKKAYMEVRKKTLRSALTLAAVILLISLIEIYLMLRASFLSRIKEVGTLRAIGLKKSDIYKKFAGEIIAINLITSVIGIGAMYYILSNVIKVSDSFASNYAVNPVVAFLTFAILLIFNLMVGLLPVAAVMRKTPAQILARSDV